MADPALGTKRLCVGCTAKFYDLGKDPIVCPSCETVFVIPKAPPPRGRAGFDRGRPAVALAEAEAPAAEAKDETETESDAEDSSEDAEGGVPMLEEIDEK